MELYEAMKKHKMDWKFWLALDYSWYVIGPNLIKKKKIGPNSQVFCSFLILQDWVFSFLQTFLSLMGYGY